jgi:hypothetical protein
MKVLSSMSLKESSLFKKTRTSDPKIEDPTDKIKLIK